MDRKRRNHYSSTDEAGDSTADDAELVASDSEDASGRARKYVVKRDRSDRFSLCEPLSSRLSRNERICVVAGAFILAAVVLIFIIIAIAVNVSASGSSHGSSSSGSPDYEPWSEIRLPVSVVPDSYNIQLDVDMEDFVVTGAETITATVEAETRYVILHANAMTITEAVVSQGDSSQSLEIGREFPFPDNQFYVIELSSVLSKGKVNISLKFNYTLGDKLVGFYRSSYVDSFGQKHYLAVTQFEPTDARRAFPCFDEPALKANFTIHITHDALFNATSNMPGQPEPDENGKVTTHFETSVKMSTYLVAFVVSEFWCVSGTTGGRGFEVQECEKLL